MEKRNRPPSQPSTPGAPRTLRVWRAERDLTQQALATRATVTVTRYWQIEHGRGAPVRLWERILIAQGLAVAPEAIAWPTNAATRHQQLREARAAAREQRRRTAMRGAGMPTDSAP